MLIKTPQKTQAQVNRSLVTEPEHLSDFEHEENWRILHETDDIIIIDKPEYVRMDGDFPVTVEKLVNFWRPHIPLSEPISTRAEKKGFRQRWIHQLDYATSGVLCIGLTYEGTKRVREPFEQHRVKKCYLAIVHGHVDIKQFPIRPQLNTGIASNKTNQGISSKPAPSFFEEHKFRLRKKVTAGETITEDESKLLTMKWNQVKRDPVLRGPYDLLAEDDLKRARAEKQKQSVVPEFVGAYQVAQNSTDDEVGCVARGEIVIDVPIAEVDDDFRSYVGTETLPGRSARTVAQIIAHGTWHSMPVTKLLLKPQTGRKHQLRLHTAYLGHPIVGDATYAPEFDELDTFSPRMMLHAWSLSLACGNRQSGGGNAPEIIEVKTRDALTKFFEEDSSMNLLALSKSQP